MPDPTDREIDERVARVMGLVPCDRWKRANFGSMGGAVLMSDGCPHEKGKCYPTITAGNIHGKIGGCPDFCADPRPLKAWLVEREDVGEFGTTYDDDFDPPWCG